MIDITVILCTYNRCESLASSLDSVAALRMPDSVSWEVLVVDNNSTDGTRDVVEGYGRRNPERFRYLLESKQGLCHARNAGVENARGKIIAFTDDDAIVESTWLQNLTATLHGDEWAGAGGRILPEKVFSRPEWMPTEGRYPLGPLAMFDLGGEARSLHEPPFGVSMAFRKAMFEKYGRFRIDLDRCGNDLISNGDTEFGQRLLESGERLRYEPSAVTYHCVPQSRIQKRYFLDWWFNKARSDIRQQGGAGGTKWRVAGVPLLLLPRLCVSVLRWATTIETRRRFSNKIAAWSCAGQIREYYHLRTKPKG